MHYLRYFLATVFFFSALNGMQPEDILPIKRSYTFICGVSGRQGTRGYMEDRYSASLNLNGDSQQAFFGIFDGHGAHGVGHIAAEIAASYIPHYYLTALRQGLPVHEALFNAYIFADRYIQEQINSSGTTALTVAMDDGQAYLGWTGDSRGMIIGNVRDNNVPYFMTTDHKPDERAEAMRIEREGGMVMQDNHGTYRINGLSMSRALGDKDLKQQPGLIADPAIKQYPLEPGTIIFLASDGFWNNFPEPAEVASEVGSLVNYIQPQYADPIKRNNPADPGNGEKWFEEGNSELLKVLATYFRNKAYNRNVRSSLSDNITVMIIQVLPALPVLPVQ